MSRYPFDVEIVLLLIISFIAAGVSGFSSEALGIWKAYFFEPALFFILFLNVFKAKEDLKKILWPLVISALVVSGVAIYQAIAGGFIFNEIWSKDETRRATSFFGYPNAVGLYLGPIILLLAGFLADKIKFSRIIILTIVFSLAAIYFAKSEGAILAVAVSLILFGILAGGKIRRIALILILAGFLGIAVYAPVRDFLFDKIALRDLSGQIRKSQWAETWEMLGDGRLFFGAGLANYQNAVKPHHKEGIFVRDYNDPEWHRKTVFNEEYRKQVWQPVEIYLYPHNIFLNFWSELGFLGMLLFIWIFIKFYYLSIKILFKNLKFKIKNFEQENNKYLIIGLIGAMTVVIIHGQVDVPYFKNDLAVMFWLLLAIMSIIDLELKKEK